MIRADFYMGKDLVSIIMPTYKCGKSIMEYYDIQVKDLSDKDEQL